MPSKSASACMASAGPSLGAKFDGQVDTILSITGSYCHLTRSATASPATRLSAATMSPTAIEMPGTLTDRVNMNADAGASWPTIRLAITVRGDCTHIFVVG